MRIRVAGRDDMVRLISEALLAQEEGREIPFVVRRSGGGRIVGSTRLLDLRPEDRGAEIGWTWFSPAVWRTPVNTESKYLLLRHCFETLNLIRVQLKTDARNVRAQRAIERLGAVREGVLRHHYVMPDGYLRDSVYYSILAEEWPVVRERLEGLLLGRPRAEA
jgi:RimJ/RimL family protein N-acetyltransferase